MVRNVVQLFYREFRGLHQAAYVLALFAFASQLLALVRDRALAHTFGAGAELDLYYAAFRIPDVMFVVFSSMLSVYVLIPFVARLQSKKNDDAAAQLLGQMFSFFLITYSMLAVTLFITAPTVLGWLFPSLTAESADTLTILFRVLLIQPFLLGLSSLFGVITQLRQRFIIYAVSPILYNLGIILGIYVLYPILGLPGLVWGVIVGAVAHAGVQLPLVLKSPLRFRPQLPDWQQFREIIAVAFPRAITLSLNQLVLLVLTVIAAGMTVGSVSVFQFAWNLQSVPLTIIGVSYSVAAFPVLAKLLASEEFEKFKTHIKTAFRHIIFWSIPVIVLVIILRAHLVRVLLGSGNFSWDDTRLTAAILAIFMVALLAQALNLLTIRAFYAHGNTRTPLLVAVIGSAVTLSITWFIYTHLYSLPIIKSTLESWLRLTDVPGSEVVVLAVGFSIGVTIQALLMVWLLQRNFVGICYNLWPTIRNALIAATSGGTATYLTLQFIVSGINQNTFMGIFLQGSLAAAAGIFTIYLAYRHLDSPEFNEIKGAVARRYSFSRFLGIARD